MPKKRTARSQLPRPHQNFFREAALAVLAHPEKYFQHFLNEGPPQQIAAIRAEIHIVRLEQQAAKRHVQFSKKG